MKNIFAVVAAAAAFVAGVAAQNQDLSSLPQCGQVCIPNMIQKAVSMFGCEQGNVTCYCVQPRFGYGVRDCAYEACGNVNQAQEVVSYGVQYCADALAADGITTTAASTSVVATSAMATANSSLTTAAIYATVTTDGSTVTTIIGSTTLDGNVVGIGGIGDTTTDTTTVATGTDDTTAGYTGPVVIASATSMMTTTTSGSGGSLNTNTVTSTNTDQATVTAMSSTDSPAGAVALQTGAPLLGAAAVLALLAL